VNVSFGVFGKHEADARRIAAVDFFSNSEPGHDAPGTLFRDQGEPIPGTLLWVDQSRRAIDSPLGVLTLPRQGVMRYVFPAARKTAVSAPPSTDEVGLMDGSILHGTARPVAPTTGCNGTSIGGVRLEHPILGTLKLDARAVRSVVRLDGRAWSLARLVPQSVTSAGPFGLAKKGPRSLSDVGGHGPFFASALTIQPETALRYRLDQAKGRALALRARVEPIEGARGDARLLILAGGKTVAEREVVPGAGPDDIAVDLPATDVEIRVDFGRRIAFPCGVVLADALVVARG
jgi:hypothetical protein